MSTIVGYTPIQSGDPATPGTFNSRMSQLQENISALNTDKLETVGTSDIENLAVTNSKLASNAVTNSKILDNTIVASSKLNSGSLDFSTMSIDNLRITYGSSYYKHYINASTGALAVDYINAIGGASGSRTILDRYGQLSLGVTRTPSGTSNGVAGSITWDSSYLYVCVSTNSWRRVALSAF